MDDLMRERLADFVRSASALNEAWKDGDASLDAGYPFGKSFDEVAEDIEAWFTKQTEGETTTTPRHYAGPYGHDYYYLNGDLVAQPSLASGLFIVNTDEITPVDEFAEPLTEAELAEVKKALA